MEATLDEESSWWAELVRRPRLAIASSRLIYVPTPVGGQPAPPTAGSWFFAAPPRSQLPPSGG